MVRALNAVAIFGGLFLVFLAIGRDDPVEPVRLGVFGILALVGLVVLLVGVVRQRRMARAST
jgi:hypothetical protein